MERQRHFSGSDVCRSYYGVQWAHMFSTASVASNDDSASNVHAKIISIGFSSSLSIRPDGKAYGPPEFPMVEPDCGGPYTSKTSAMIAPKLRLVRTNGVQSLVKKLLFCGRDSSSVMTPCSLRSAQIPSNFTRVGGLRLPCPLRRASNASVNPAPIMQLVMQKWSCLRTLQ